MPHDPRAPHPRQEPRIPLPPSLESLQQVFEGCVDFVHRTVRLNGDPKRTVTVCYVDGMAKTERLNDYVMRPLARTKELAQAPAGQVFDLMASGILYAQNAFQEDSMDKIALALINGSCAIFCPGEPKVLVVPVATEEKRSISKPDNEPSIKGAGDSFVESVRTNTSLVRRRLRAPELRVKEHILGRQSLTPVDLLYINGIADPDTVERVSRRLDEVDIDGVESAGDLEEYLVDGAESPFPLISNTQRPDRFCRGLLEGRVGVIADGLPLGFLVPGTLDQSFGTSQDRAIHWMAATALRALRYLCALITLLLPGLYIALVTYHPEAIPAKLAMSIAAAKQQVPFSTIFEVLTMLLAFEVVQEAGLRFPGPVGATVSILGGLVIGNAAVDAHIVSPAVLIAVAAAGVTGYAIPGPDLGNALRLWRFLLAILSSLGGLTGLAAGCALLVMHLAGLESFGVPYLAPFTTGRSGTPHSPSLVRLPLQRMKWRNGAIHTENRRNQR